MAVILVMKRQLLTGKADGGRSGGTHCNVPTPSTSTTSPRQVGGAAPVPVEVSILGIPLTEKSGDRRRLDSIAWLHLLEGWCHRSERSPSKI